MLYDEPASPFWGGHNLNTLLFTILLSRLVGGCVACNLTGHRHQETGGPHGRPSGCFYSLCSTRWQFGHRTLPFSSVCCPPFDKGIL